MHLESGSVEITGDLVGHLEKRSVETSSPLTHIPTCNMHLESGSVEITGHLVGHLEKRSVETSGPLTHIPTYNMHLGSGSVEIEKTENRSSLQTVEASSA
eukprot:1147909-Pelagomonas_calceolata.AAC.6